jgi:hypothetical protein
LIDASPFHGDRPAAPKLAIGLRRRRDATDPALDRAALVCEAECPGFRSRESTTPSTLAASERRCEKAVVNPDVPQCPACGLGIRDGVDAAAGPGPATTRTIPTTSATDTPMAAFRVSSALDSDRSSRPDRRPRLARKQGVARERRTIKGRPCFFCGVRFCATPFRTSQQQLTKLSRRFDGHSKRAIQ